MNDTASPRPSSRTLPKPTTMSIPLCPEWPETYAARASQRAAADLDDIVLRAPTAHGVDLQCLTTIVNCLSLLPIQANASERQIPLTYFTDAFGFPPPTVVDAADWLSQYTDCYDNWRGFVSRIIWDDEYDAMQQVNFPQEGGR